MSKSHAEKSLEIALKHMEESAKFDLKVIKLVQYIRLQKPQTEPELYAAAGSDEEDTTEAINQALEILQGYGLIRVEHEESHEQKQTTH